MSIKSIVVPIRGDGKGESVLNLAVAIGKKFNAHIDVLHVHAKPEDMIPYGVPLTAAFKRTIMEAADNLAQQEEERLAALFHKYCKDHNIEEVPVDADSFPLDRLSISWHEEAGKQAAVIRREVRFCDLIVVPKPDRQAMLGMNTLEAALFDVRKLTAVAPTSPAETAGSHVCIAWNGSAEAARAVNWTLPVLAAADQVSVLIAPDENVEDASTKSVQRYLQLHGIRSRLHEFRGSRNNIGGPLLEKVAEIGGDMMVMGAFGSEKRRELVLGGVTEFVIENAELPILMAH